MKKYLNWNNFVLPPFGYKGSVLHHVTWLLSYQLTCSDSFEIGILVEWKFTRLHSGQTLERSKVPSLSDCMNPEVALEDQVGSPTLPVMQAGRERRPLKPGKMNSEATLEVDGRSPLMPGNMNSETTVEVDDRSPLMPGSVNSEATVEVDDRSPLMPGSVNSETTVEVDDRSPLMPGNVNSEATVEVDDRSPLMPGSGYSEATVEVDDRSPLMPGSVNSEATVEVDARSPLMPGSVNSEATVEVDDRSPLMPGNVNSEATVEVDDRSPLMPGSMNSEATVEVDHRSPLMPDSMNAGVNMEYDERRTLLPGNKNSVMAQEAHERSPLLPGSINTEDEHYVPEVVVHTKIYYRRWYILLLFSFLSATQGCIWNTWSPIANSAHTAFGWENADIALLSNWGPITFILSSFFFSWLMDTKGLRMACLGTAALVCGGSGLRCVTSTPPAVTWLTHAGHILNGFGGPVAMATPSVLSAVWFPPEQRTTSTAIGQVFNGLGVGVSFIIAPLLIQDMDPNGNGTGNASLTNPNAAGVMPVMPRLQDSAHVQQLRDEIMKLMYIEFGWSALLFIAILVYIPKKPPIPPSVSATVNRVDFKQGLREIIKIKDFWLLCIPYGIGSGVYNCWVSVLEVNFRGFGIGQVEAGWIGWYTTIASSAVGLLTGRFADIFAGHMKRFLLAFFIAACGLTTWLALSSIHILPATTATVYISTILLGASMAAVVPLFYELSCETVYPIAEGVTNGIITLANNVSGLIFLLILMIPSIGTTWMNWFLLGSLVASVPALVLYKERYARLILDTGSNTKLDCSSDQS